MQATDKDRCPNCDEPRTGRWCARCGQDNRYATLRFADAVRDGIGVFFGVEGRLRKTLVGLTKHPGSVARNYLDGHRARYMHPLRYMFVACALWWSAVGIALVDADLSNYSAGFIAVLRHGSIVNLLMVPLLAIATWLAFVGSRRTVLEHYYILCFATGHIFLWRAALALTGPLFPASWEAGIVLTEQICSLLFTAWTLWGAYRGIRWLWARLILALLVLVYGTGVLTELAAKLLVG